MTTYVRCACCGVPQEQGAHSDQPAGVRPLTGAKTTAERERILAKRRAEATFLSLRRGVREGTITLSAAEARLRAVLSGDAG